MENILQTNTLRDRLLLLVQKFGNISGSELAKRVNLPIPTVNRLLSGSVTDPRASTLLPISEYFGITVDQLLGKSPLPQHFHQDELFKPSISLPKISLSEVCSLKENLKSAKSYFSYLIDSKRHQVNNNLFALDIQNNDFLPTFNAGTILIINPNLLPPEHMDYVLVKFKKNLISIKRFHVDPPYNYFISLSPGFENVIYNEKEQEILGIVIEAHTQLK